MHLAKNLPNAPFPQAEAGMWDSDEQYPWDGNLARFPGYTAISYFLSTLKDHAEADPRVHEMPEVHMTKEQEAVLDLLELQIASLEDTNIAISVECVIGLKHW